MTTVKVPLYIQTILGRYYRALKTKDFIYFVNYQEGDENGCCIMYNHKMKLISNNYFGFEAMWEDLMEKKYTHISRTMKANLKLYLEDMKQNESQHV